MRARAHLGAQPQARAVVGLALAPPPVLHLRRAIHKQSAGGRSTALAKDGERAPRHDAPPGCHGGGGARLGPAFTSDAAAASLRTGWHAVAPPTARCSCQHFGGVAAASAPPPLAACGSSSPPAPSSSSSLAATPPRCCCSTLLAAAARVPKSAPPPSAPSSVPGSGRNLQGTTGTVCEHGDGRGGAQGSTQAPGVRLRYSQVEPLCTLATAEQWEQHADTVQRPGRPAGEGADGLHGASMVHAHCAAELTRHCDVPLKGPGGAWGGRLKEQPAWLPGANVRGSPQNVRSINWTLPD